MNVNLWSKGKKAKAINSTRRNPRLKKTVYNFLVCHFSSIYLLTTYNFYFILSIHTFDNATLPHIFAHYHCKFRQNLVHIGRTSTTAATHVTQIISILMESNFFSIIAKFVPHIFVLDLFSSSLNS